MIDVTVTQRREEAEGICSFELAAADGRGLPAFTPGAHIDVHLPGGLMRQYLLCPGAEQADRYLIAVLREAASRGGSAAMHALQAGDRLRIDALRNQRTSASRRAVHARSRAGSCSTSDRLFATMLFGDTLG